MKKYVSFFLCFFISLILVKSIFSMNNNCRKKMYGNNECKKHKNNKQDSIKDAQENGYNLKFRNFSFEDPAFNFVFVLSVKYENFDNSNKEKNMLVIIRKEQTEISFFVPEKIGVNDLRSIQVELFYEDEFDKWSKSNKKIKPSEKNEFQKVEIDPISTLYISSKNELNFLAFKNEGKILFEVVDNSEYFRDPSVEIVEKRQYVAQPQQEIFHVKDKLRDLAQLGNMDEYELDFER
jgi:hypothetical protein